MSSTESGVRRVQDMLDFLKMLDAGGGADFVSTFLPHLEVVSATDVMDHNSRHPHATFSYTVQQEHCNRGDNMHGGAIAALFDMTTGIAQVLGDGPVVQTSSKESEDALADQESSSAGVGPTTSWSSVSRTLNVKYLRPAPSGEPLLVECEIVHQGKRLSGLRGVMRRQRDNKVVAMCEHDKVTLDTERL